MPLFTTEFPLFRRHCIRDTPSSHPSPYNARDGKQNTFHQFSILSISGIPRVCQENRAPNAVYGTLIFFAFQLLGDRKFAWNPKSDNVVSQVQYTFSKIPLFSRTGRFKCSHWTMSSSLHIVCGFLCTHTNWDRTQDGKQRYLTHVPARMTVCDGVLSANASLRQDALSWWQRQPLYARALSDGTAPALEGWKRSKH